MNRELCGNRIIHQEIIDEALKNALAQDDIMALCRLFKAFADPSRLRILHALDNREMCVCDLAAFLNISESAVSHQLRMLRNLNLVTNRRQGTILYYRIADEHVTALIALAREHHAESAQLTV